MAAEIESTDFRVISLTKGFFALVDACDYERIAQREWQASVRADGKVYAIRHAYSDGQYVTVSMHREILYAPGEMLVDHIEPPATLDNRGCNLRFATHSQNLANRRIRKDSQTRFKGVSLHKRTGRYAAHIRVNKIRLHLGYRSNPEEAHELYCEAARKHFGEFARFA